MNFFSLQATAVDRCESWLQSEMFLSNSIDMMKNLRKVYYIKGVSKVSRLTNCRFTTISSQISAIYINIFHKTEVQTVILRCWTGLVQKVWQKWKTGEKCKRHQNHQNSTWIILFFTKSHKNENGNNCILCHNFWTN